MPAYQFDQFRLDIDTSRQMLATGAAFSDYLAFN